MYDFDDDGYDFTDSILVAEDTDFLDGVELLPVPNRNAELICGHWYKFACEKTGFKRAYIYACRRWRTCTECFTKRMETYRQQIYRYACGNDTCQLICDDHTWENLVKHKLDGKQGFQRFPQADGTTMAFLSAEFNLGTPLTADDIHNLDWNTIAMTREECRVSGHLQIPISVVVEPEEPKVTITNCAISATKTDASGVITEISNDEDDLCYYEAMAITLDLDPQTPEELQTALYKRINAYTSALVRHGWQVKQHYQKRKIVSKGYIWGKSLLSIFQRLVNLGLVKPEQKPYFKPRDA